MACPVAYTITAVLALIITLLALCPGDIGKRLREYTGFIATASIIGALIALKLVYLK